VIDPASFNFTKLAELVWSKEEAVAISVFRKVQLPLSAAPGWDELAAAACAADIEDVTVIVNIKVTAIARTCMMRVPFSQS
jgi:hypothetical protein